MREQFVTSQTAGDASRNQYFINEAREINREIDALGTRFPDREEALPPRIDVEQLQRTLEPVSREREDTLAISR